MALTVALNLPGARFNGAQTPDITRGSHEHPNHTPRPTSARPRSDCRARRLYSGLCPWRRRLWRDRPRRRGWVLRRRRRRLRGFPWWISRRLRLSRRLWLLLLAGVWAVPGHAAVLLFDLVVERGALLLRGSQL